MLEQEFPDHDEASFEDRHFIVIHQPLYSSAEEPLLGQDLGMTVKFQGEVKFQIAITSQIVPLMESMM